MSFFVDLHCHTHASPDGSLREADIKHQLLSGNLHAIAITDHNTVSEAQRLKEVYGNAIIVGEEISAIEGEIIGLFLSEAISPGLTVTETIRRIKEQDGVVYIPHPFEKVRKGISLNVLEHVKEDIDAIEVINGRSFSKKAQLLASTWAQTHHIPRLASSDAHGRIGWGRVKNEFAQVPDRETFSALAATASIIGVSNGLRSYGYPTLNRWRNR